MVDQKRKSNLPGKGGKRGGRVRPHNFSESAITSLEDTSRKTTRFLQLHWSFGTYIYTYGFSVKSRPGKNKKEWMQGWGYTRRREKEKNSRGFLD